MKVNRRLAIGGVILILAFALGFSSLWGYYNYSPSAKLLRGLKLEVAEGINQLRVLRDEEVPKKKEYLAKLAKVQQDFQKINQLSDELEEMFPKEERLGELLDLLSRTTEADGITLLRIEPGEPIDQGSWSEIPIGLEFRCDLLRLQTYLTSLENMPRFVRINSFNIVLRDNGILQVEGEIICSAFVFKEVS